MWPGLSVREEALLLSAGFADMFLLLLVLVYFFFVMESHENAFGGCTFCFVLWIEAFWGVYFGLWSLGGLGMHEAEMLQSRA